MSVKKKAKSKKDNVTSTFAKEGKSLAESVVNASGKTKGTANRKKATIKKPPAATQSATAKGAKKVPVKKATSVRH